MSVNCCEKHLVCSYGDTFIVAAEWLVFVCDVCRMNGFLSYENFCFLGTFIVVKTFEDVQLCITQETGLILKTVIFMVTCREWGNSSC